jgi:glycosyltransferase involved in cell wall biosynthesis
MAPSAQHGASDFVIGAVVPVCNRRANLELLLASLEEQTYRAFTVVVADDGSTDGTREFVEDTAQSPTWSGRLQWVGCGPDLGVRTGRARNIGAANVPDATSLMVMLDSDLVLQPEAMALFDRAHRAHPDVVLFGGDYGPPPHAPATVIDAVRNRDLRSLQAQVPRIKPARVEGTFTGPELRDGLFDLPADQPIPLRPEWALPLNSGWPLPEYWRAGGFDEAMRGYGYQDMEFGARAAQAGIFCLPRAELWALHVWHPKPAKAMLENQRNLDRYLRQHGAFLRGNGPSDLLEIDVDWTLWWHYHAERGGTVARSAGCLWAVNGNREHRLHLPDDGWLSKLGHCPHEVGVLAVANLDRMVDHGVASEQP